MEEKEAHFEKVPLSQEDKAILRRRMMYSIALTVFFIALAISGILSTGQMFSSSLAIAINLFIMATLLTLLYFVFKSNQQVFRDDYKLVFTGVIRSKEHNAVRGSYYDKQTRETKTTITHIYKVFVDGFEHIISKKDFKRMRLGDTVALNYTGKRKVYLSAQILKRGLESLEDDFSSEDIRTFDISEEDEKRIKSAYVFHQASVFLGCLPLPFGLMILIFGISSGIPPVLATGIVSTLGCFMFLYFGYIKVALLKREDIQFGKKEILPAIVVDKYQSDKSQDSRHFVETTKGLVKVTPEQYKPAQVGESVLVMRTAHHKKLFGIHAN